MRREEALRRLAVPQSAMDAFPRPGSGGWRQTRKEEREKSGKYMPVYTKTIWYKVSVFFGKIKHKQSISKLVTEK